MTSPDRTTHRLIGGLFVAESGEGVSADGAGCAEPTVVFVHGSLDRHTSFARLGSRVGDLTHVVAYDRRGYARSRHADPPPRGVADHVDDLAAVVDAVAGSCPVVVLGHSYGGVVALAFAAARPELVRALVVFEPPLAWLEWWDAPPTGNGGVPSARRHVVLDAPSPAAAAEAFLRRVIGDRRYERLPAATRAEIALDGPALVAELSALRRDPPPFDPATIRAPVVVGAGSKSPERNRRAARLLAALLPAGELAVVDGAGHGAHLTHPAELAALVRRATQRSDVLARGR